MGRTALTNYDRTILDDKPTCYWPMDDSSGTVCRELVRGINGIYTAGAVLQSIKGPGRSFMPYFSGAGAGVTVPFKASDPLFTLGSAFSYECWFMTNTLAAGATREFFSCEPAESGPIALRIDSTAESGSLSGFVFSGAGAEPRATVVNMTGLKIICYACLTFDGATLKVYANTSSTSQARAVTPDAQVGALRLGGYISGASDHWMNRAAVYPFTLSAAQATAHYNAGHQ